jgi:hypothetical protein
LRTTYRTLPLALIVVVSFFEAAAATSSITLTSSPNPSTYGQVVSLTATVTAGAAGTVTFYDGAIVLGTARVVSGAATLSTPSLGAGRRRLKAYYLGDSNFTASTSPVGAHTVQAVSANVFAATTYTPGLPTYQVAVAVADFNGDGKADLIWSGYLGAGIMLGNGDGTFQPSRTISIRITVSSNHQITIADFNGDGKPDIAIADQGPDRVQILLGNGDGTFRSGATLNVATFPMGLATADFNGDGYADLVYLGQGQVSIYLGTGDGNFLPPVQVVSDNFLSEMAVGDFNGDGNADLVVTSSTSDPVGAKILFGNGDGTFRNPLLINTVHARAIAVADFDQDGLDDIAIVFITGVQILMGTNDGSIRFNGWNSLSGYANNLLAKGDFNGDGTIDLVVETQDGQIVVLPGYGNGTFGAGIPYQRSQNPFPIVEGDFNGDGRTDLIVPEPTSGYLTILYGVSATMTSAGTPQSTRLGMAFPNPLQMTIKDGGGNPAGGVTVTYSSGSTGASAVLSSTTAVTNAAGVASITATANNTVGSYAVLASAGTLTATFSLSNTADVPASLTARSGTPQSVTAGMPFPVALTAVLKNSSGQPVSGAAISFTAPAGILLSSTTSTTDATGMAQVWATASNSGGTHTVVASAGSLSTNFSLTVLTPVAVTLGTSPNPSKYGQQVTLTATVPTGVTGTVTFYDGVLVLGTAPVVSQSAARSTILIQSGSRTLTARYNGDSSHPVSRSNSVAQTVTPTPNSSFAYGNATPIVDTYALGYGPSFGLTGDFNGDGMADLAIGSNVSAGNGNVRVLLSNGDGTFRSGAKTSFAGSVGSVATGDFNGDGKADLAVGTAGGLAVLLSKGDGSMGAPVYYVMGTVSSIVVTDLNRDGLADLVVLDYTNNTLNVLFGNGDGTFRPPVSYDTGGKHLKSLVVADFNGDGSPDFAFTADSSAVTVVMGNPDGTLQPIRQFNAGSTVEYLAVADFNGDGKADLIAVGSYNWSVLAGNGDGTFQLLGPTMSSTFIAGPVVADFNGDGKYDVAMYYGVGNDTQGVLFLFGNGDGTFQTPVNYTGSSYYIPIGSGDFTGGGKAQLALLDRGNYSALLLRDRITGVAISSTHDALWQGITGASYYLTVKNNQATATTGVVKVTDTIPDDLTATGIAGTGWSCDRSSLTCTRSDSLAPGASFPSINLTFNVAPNAPSQVINSASVSVSGTLVASVEDSTSIIMPINSTTTTLTVSPSPVNLGQSVTLTAQVPRAFLGFVLFYDGTTLLGSNSLDTNSRSTMIMTNSLPAGIHLLHAYFRGNALDVPSTSATVSLTVRAGASSGFAPFGGYTVTGNAYSIAAGDFNGDGKADLAIANGTGISTLLGSGNATFQSPVDYTANRATRFVTTFDFNGDGKMDLVTANPSSNDVTVFLANADGSFRAGVNYPAGAAPYSVSIGDVDGDGIVDLVVPNFSSASITILVGKGDGTFRPYVTYQVGTGPYSVAIGDFNGDGKADLAVTSSAGAVSIMIAKGSGGFQAPVSVTVGMAPVAIVTGDFNSDGKLDLAVANANSNNISVLLGNGDGTFKAAVNYAAGGTPAALVIGDFNGDGNPDLAAANGLGAGAAVLLGNGDGSFRAPVVYAAGVSANSLAVADFNGDGKADLAVTTGNTGFTTSASRIRAAAGNNVLIYQGSAAAAAPADMNGDGKSDILWQQPDSGELWVWYMNGTATIGAAGLNGGTSWRVPAVADLNGDGKPDILWQQPSTGDLWVWYMNGTTMTGAASINGATTWRVVGTGDFNGDGKTDILWQEPASGELWVWYMNGSSQIGAAPLGGSTAWKVVGTADINGDGKPDILWQGPGGDLWVWFMNGTAQTGAAPLGGGTAWKVVGTGDFNGDGKPDILWQLPSIGDLWVWFMNGTAQTGAAPLGGQTTWKAIGAR